MVILSRNLILSFLIFNSLISYSQEGEMKIVGENKEILITVDSLSFVDNHPYSQYFFDQKKNEGYTGVAVVLYGKKACDSIEVVQGYSSGWKKTYQASDDFFNLVYVRYINKDIYISSLIKTELKPYLSFVRYTKDGTGFSFQVKYKKCGTIIVKQKFKKDGKVKKKRVKVDSLGELKVLFSSHPKIFSYCKQAKLFGSI